MDEVGFDWDAEEEKKHVKREKKVFVKQEKLEKQEARRMKREEEERQKAEARKMRQEKKEAKERAEDEKKAAREEKKRIKMEEQESRKMRKRWADEISDAAGLVSPPAKKTKKNAKPKTPKTKEEVLALLKASREEKAKCKGKAKSWQAVKGQTTNVRHTTKSSAEKSAKSSAASKTAKKEAAKSTPIATMAKKHRGRPTTTAPPPSTSGYGPKQSAKKATDIPHHLSVGSPLPFLAPPPGIALPSWAPPEVLTAPTTKPKNKAMSDNAGDEKSHLERQKAAAAAAAYYAQMAKAWQEVAEREAKEAKQSEDGNESSFLDGAGHVEDEGKK
mmetsp:Transcript_48146/g.145419  ORF Transcript_48146/g.145419 Transcript_48146/m.145419 type:complete len:331 (+) Transcript_48146:166-1158(+)